MRRAAQEGCSTARLRVLQRSLTRALMNQGLRQEAARVPQQARAPARPRAQLAPLASDRDDDLRLHFVSSVTSVRRGVLLFA